MKFESHRKQTRFNVSVETVIYDSINKYFNCFKFREIVDKTMSRFSEEKKSVTLGETFFSTYFTYIHRIAFCVSCGTVPFREHSIFRLLTSCAGN